ncbi:MAG: PPC domain-containing protein, partial [Thermoguttaceae bacterium]
QFRQDPILFVDVPSDGIYTLEIQDAIFRGREDFTYRITISDLPVATSLFPLGGQSGAKVQAEIAGWNLPNTQVSLNTDKSDSNQSENRERTLSVLEMNDAKKQLLFPVRYSVNDLPEIIETENNNDIAHPQKVSLPVIINGRIENKNDVDFFSFEGKKGSQIVLDVSARSLDSPLDSHVEIRNAAGMILAENDDRADSRGPNIGLETYHADSYLMCTIPEDGTYFVCLTNRLRRGGQECCYRLRISEPIPDFALFCEPSSLSFSGNTEPLKIHVIRIDNFQEPIDIQIQTPNAPFQLDGATIPPGVDQITISVSTSPEYNGKPFPLNLTGTAMINETKISRPIIPCDDWEQAFIYHHLMQTDAIYVMRIRGRLGQMDAIQLHPDQTLPVRIPGMNETLSLRFLFNVLAKQKRETKEDFQKQLSFTIEPSAAFVTLKESHWDNDELVLTLSGAESVMESPASVTKTTAPSDPVERGNLIIGINGRFGNQPVTKMGILPAIPFVCPTESP